jgi:hypothetical protein
MVRKLIVSTGLATFAVAVTAVAGVVDAGRPRVQGCHGESISALASNQAAPGAFGTAVVGFAQAPDGQPGLGDGIRLLHAGLVDDEVVPNTCND